MSQTFDLDERARIRAKLLHYKEQNRIGAPALVLRMAKKLKREPLFVPQKILQRFLQNEGRVHDPFVEICRQFVSDLPDTDPAAELGEQLARFFNIRAETDHPGTSDPDRLTGTYSLYADSLTPSARICMTRIQEAPRSFPNFRSRCTLRRYSSQGPLLVTEEETTEASDSDYVETAAQKRCFEGAAFLSCAGIILISKNTATRHPRILWVSEYPRTVWSCNRTRIGTRSGKRAS